MAFRRQDVNTFNGTDSSVMDHQCGFSCELVSYMLSSIQLGQFLNAKFHGLAQ